MAQLSLRRLSRTVLVAAALLSVSGLSGFALLEDHRPALLDHLAKPRTGGHLGIRGVPVLSLAEEDPLREDWERFAALQGGDLRIWIDLRSGLPTLTLGPGLAWTAEGRGDLEQLAGLAEEFLRSHPSILGEWGDQIELARAASVRRGESVWQIRFAQVVEGVTVEGASYDFHVSRGNLVAFGARRWAPVRISATPSLDAERARDSLDLYLGTGAGGGQNFDLAEPELLLIPVSPDPTAEGAYTGPRGEGYAHRLIWRFRFTDLEGIATWTGEVDAHDGEIVAFYDDTDYQRIKGHVNPLSDDGQCETGGCRRRSRAARSSPSTTTPTTSASRVT